MQINLNYGALSDTIEEQLNKQGCTLGDKAETLRKWLLDLLSI